jgi:cytoplasmic iron level regulating protein YaaA (DUF328/UPF0246 family)
MKVLLSPAKKIDMNKEIQTTETTVPELLNDAESLMKKMKKFSSKKIGTMMHLSTDLSDLNYERNQNWKPITEKDSDSTHAIAAFDGEVYRGFDATSLSKEQLTIAQDKVRILSGLYGILKPLDVIYPYRLEMGTKWAVTPAKKNLYQFWGKRIGDLINSEEEDVIVNCASTEYFKATNTKELKARIITPVFKDLKNGEYKTIMVFAKKARGAMARFIVDNNIQDPEMVKGFDWEGYGYDANLSSENEWVFTR